jgi:hypothetical protein
MEGWLEPYIYAVYTVILAGKAPNIRCKITVLANPTHVSFLHNRLNLHVPTTNPNPHIQLYTMTHTTHTQTHTHTHTQNVLTLWMAARSIPANCSSTSKSSLPNSESLYGAGGGPICSSYVYAVFAGLWCVFVGSYCVRT